MQSEDGAPGVLSDTDALQDVDALEDLEYRRLHDEGHSMKVWSISSRHLRAEAYRSIPSGLVTLITRIVLRM